LSGDRALRLTLSFALIGWFAVPALADGDVRAGQEIYAVCAGCHGFAGEGNAAVHAPKLAGLAAWDIARQLDHFRRGIRGTAEADRFGKLMATMALALADARATEDVVAHITQLPPVKSRRTLSGNAERGREQYALCGACHGAQGEGNEPLNAPKLAGLDDWYTVVQLEAFKQGVRGSHPEDVYGQQMRAIAAAVDTQQAIDIASFIATL
jgi:cytochrome c oxidase subunit 2